MTPSNKVKSRANKVNTSLFLRIFLLVGVILIAFVFIYYTQNVVGNLKINASRMVHLSIKLLQLELSSQTSDIATGVIFDEIIAPTDIPIIITDSEDQPLFIRNVSGMKVEEVTDENIDKLKEIMQEMFEKNGRFPIKHFDSESKTETVINYFYYGDPKLIVQLQTMPFVEIGLVAIFIIIGYIGYRNIKRSEQNYIWVGMAKETAHQLGTPISSLMGWLELLRSDADKSKTDYGLGDEQFGVREISSKMSNDINRLQKIANRFSQIGSRPTLKSADLNMVISEIVDYFKERLPYQGKGVSIDFIPGLLTNVMINKELIGWVIENLIKNSLEACDPRNGKITIATSMSTDTKLIIAEFGDNGKGVAPGSQRKIFHPGYTSKKRGWGLGLSLAKRIVEEYHGGKISLKMSVQNRETIMQVCLPIENNK